MDTGTRRKILEMLKRDGPQAAARMAETLGISAMAVRPHLYTLAQEGLVAATSEPTGVGRPSKNWHLTEAAHAFFPQGYAELTAGLMSSVRDVFGDEGLDRLVARRTREQIASYGARMTKAKTLATRLKVLSEIRTEEGYMAEVERAGGGWLFTENHCPICAVAKSCTGLCTSELELFQNVLGPGVTVERIEHILAGARRCAYRITPD
jgi:predicted ArsR family transcriptional regulator